MKIIGFVKKVFFLGLTILSIFASINSLSCVSISNQECKTRRQVASVNGYDPVFFPFSIDTSKCSGSCNNINYPHAKICVPDVVKNLNFKVFNLTSRTNETRDVEWHETCKCWNKDKCRYECKELIVKGVCDKGFIWKPSNYKCECDKACDAGENLDYINCNCRKKLVAQLAEECTETVE